jgi:hypothetical protein
MGCSRPRLITIAFASNDSLGNQWLNIHAQAVLVDTARANPGPVMHQKIHNIWPYGTRHHQSPLHCTAEVVLQGVPQRCTAGVYCKAWGRVYCSVGTAGCAAEVYCKGVLQGLGQGVL